MAFMSGRIAWSAASTSSAARRACGNSSTSAAAALTTRSRSVRPVVAPLPVRVDIEGRMTGQMQYGTGDEITGFSRDRVDWVYLRGDITGTAMDATISNIH